MSEQITRQFYVFFRDPSSGDDGPGSGDGGWDEVLATSIDDAIRVAAPLLKELGSSWLIEDIQDSDAFPYKRTRFQEPTRASYSIE